MLCESQYARKGLRSLLFNTNSQAYDLGSLRISFLFKKRTVAPVLLVYVNHYTLKEPKSQPEFRLGFGLCFAVELSAKEFGSLIGPINFTWI